MITDFTIIFWIRYVKILFGQLNAVLQNMLTTTIDSPQHKRVLRMKDNWEDDSLLSTIYRTYKANENLKKLKRVNNEFRAEIRDFTLQLIQNPLSFTICGFFDLDYTLIRNVIATVITYLVILIQMGNIPSEFIVENSTLITNDSRKI
ncbi:hypothetical protein HZH66_002075 [Vespula vulgaris]|uniref:Uncharacterized protein n=1 Tax=Vespula vulgaris TaxID=7454 RepID=A0A834NHE3_VESVU|nr:hypothetical protein HZH66_002075 [Vespula vulgaris]